MKLLRVWQDTNAESPRTWDNLGTMVCWHQRYSLGDRHNFATPRDFLDWAEKADIAVMLPLYLYDHGGLSMSTEGCHYPCDAPWDAGQVGWIYTTESRICEAFHVKHTSKVTVSWAEKYLRREVEVYDYYLRGEVYGFTAYEINDTNIVKLDSCGEYYCTNPAENLMVYCVPDELREALRRVQSLHDGLIVTETGEKLDTGPEVLNYLKEHNILPASLLDKHQLISELVGSN